MRRRRGTLAPAANAAADDAPSRGLERRGGSYPVPLEGHEPPYERPSRVVEGSVMYMRERRRRRRSR